MDDNFHFAKQHQKDLTLTLYHTHSVEALAFQPRRKRRELLRCMMANGITKSLFGSPNVAVWSVRSRVVGRDHTKYFYPKTALKLLVNCHGSGGE